MTIQEQIAIAHQMITEGNSLVEKGNMMLKNISNKSYRIVEEDDSSKKPRKSGLTNAQKAKLLKRLG
ncbi:protein of unknown function [Tenacibaculum sp. 190524A02b]|uniref:hypothetical protein n=1 Tax=Tenacibaculum vairaonense TaxID=3137860 RepID=UPI0032B191F1